MAKNQDLDFAQESARIHGRVGRVVSAIEAYNEGLPAAAREAKYRKMAESAYTLYRGTNHLFWQDFQWDWRLNRFGGHRTRTWLNGDCHAYNFGAYFAHGVGLVYGLNDFDEAVVADYQYDLWRLAISLVLIARQNGDLSEGAQAAVLDALSKSYLKSLGRFVGNRKADDWGLTGKTSYGPLAKFLKKVGKKGSRNKMLRKWTTLVDGEPRFDRSLEDLGEVSAADRKALERAIPAYTRTLESDRSFGGDFFRVRDVALRLGAGTGSLGSARYYVLLEGDGASRDDDVILDVKQQSRPSAYPYATPEQLELYDEHFPHEGIRHALALRALEFHPEDLAGWLEIDGAHYSVRQRNPYKKSFPTEDLVSRKSFVAMAEQWGQALAAEHARAARITKFDLAREVSEKTAGHRSRFARVVREVSFGYADQVEQDWHIFRENLPPGR